MKIRSIDWYSVLKKCMMKNMDGLSIQKLSSISLDEIVACFLRSFEGYFVELPSETDYWNSRFSTSGVDYGLSFGVFDKGQLVAFVIHCTGEENGQGVVFNTGTGVLPLYRGRKLIDLLYNHAIPIFHAEGYSMARLEVIDQNVRAIRVYERIGFLAKRRLKCFQGPLKQRVRPSVKLVEVELDTIQGSGFQVVPYSWDHTIEAVRRAGDTFKTYHAIDPSVQTAFGYVILDSAKGHIAQLEAVDDRWEEVFAGICQITPTIKINNIDASRIGLLSWLSAEGVPNVIDQFEMEMPLV